MTAHIPEAVRPTHNGDMYAAAKAYVDAYQKADTCSPLAPELFDNLHVVYLRARDLVAVSALYDQPCPYDDVPAVSA